MDACNHELAYKVFAAAREGRAITIFALLCNRPKPEVDEILATVTHEDEQKTTPFLIAARNGHCSVVRLLLTQYGVDIEQTGTVKFDGFVIDGATALWCAAGAGHFDLVKALIEFKSDVNHATHSNSTPLRAACFDGRLDIVKYLVEHNADVHIPNKYKNTCLMIASYKGHATVVSYLLQHDAEPNVTASCGATALHFAAERGHLSIARELVNFGAKMYMNDQRMTPLYIAAESGRAAIVEYFISQPNCSKLEKVEALELLGASFANDKDNYDINKCYHYLWYAMQERYSDNENLLLKKVLPPIEAYENRVECETVAQLEALKHDANALHVEALIIRERILGQDNAEIPHPIVFRGAVFADMGRFDRCIALWMRVLKLRQSNERMVAKDLLRFSQVFSQMVYTGAHLEFALVEEVFQHALVEFDQDRKRITREDATKEELEIAEEMLEMNIHTALYLLCIFLKIKSTADEEYRLGKMAYCFNRKSLILKSRSNYTPLHMACDQITHVDDFHVSDIISFPDDKLVSLLIHCGANISATDLDGNTALHVIVKYNHPISDFMSLHNIIVELIDAGVHLDRSNIFGETAKDVSTTGVADILLRTKGSHSLKCEAATVIKRYQIPYKGLIPVSLEEFIEMH